MAESFMDNAREEKLDVIKNLSVLIICFNFIALTNAPTNQLQSSLYLVQGMGTTSNSVGSAMSIVSCLLLPPILAQFLGHKKVILLGFVVEAIKIAGNFYPTFATLIISKVIHNGLTYSAHASTLTLISVLCERYRKVSGRKILIIAFAIHSVFSNVASAIGEAIAYVVLNASFQNGNDSSVEEYDFRDQCGNAFVSSEHENSDNFQPPSPNFVYILFGVFLAFVVLIFLACAFFLDSTPVTRTNNKNETSRERFSLFFRTLALNRDWRAQFLFLNNIHVGLLGAFRTSDMNKAFVTCLLGMRYVGLGSVISSVFSGSFATAGALAMKRITRIPFFVFSISCEMALLLFIIYWTPVFTNDYLIVYSMTGIYGWIPPGFNIGFHVLHADLFPQDQEASFASYLLAQNLGGMIGNAYSETLAIPLQVYILLSLMTMSTICYLSIEFSVKRNARTAAVL